MRTALLCVLELLALAGPSLGRAHKNELAARQVANNESLYFNSSNLETAFQNRINVTNATTPVTLDITTQSGQRNKTSPLLYGWMFEDINHSGDGGIYAEMICNRAFQGSSVTLGTIEGIPGTSIVGSENPLLPFGPVLTGWAGIGDVRLSLDVLHPLSDTMSVALQVDILSNATGEVGILNYGKCWWGFDVSPQTYNASFYVTQNAGRMARAITGFDVSLRSNVTNQTWAASHIPLDRNVSTTGYDHYESQIVNTAQAPDDNNVFALTMNASEVAGETFYFDFVSLFPETFNNRPNGLRKDLAQAMYDLGPKFLRMPGGNNIEGYSPQTRYRWQDTLGNLTTRKARVGDWEYVNTNGLGLYEYLLWCEDIGMEPLLAIYSGYSLDISGQTGASFPASDIPMFVQDALDELEFCMGSTDTHWGGIRASLGHPEPFQINYVELGNEDFFSPTYSYRFPILYDGINKVYPNITLISTAYQEAGPSTQNVTLPAGSEYDIHYYNTPSFFVDGYNEWDNWRVDTNNSDVTIFIGEYSVFQIDTPSGVVDFSNPPDQHLQIPNLLAALSESVYLLGAEKNPNTVTMSAYAPSFLNLNSPNFTPCLVAFDANPNNTILTVSYYAQQLLNRYRGTETLPINNTKGYVNPLFWVATINEGSAIFLKVVNIAGSASPLTVQFDTSYTSVNGTILTSGSLNDLNTLDHPKAVVPKPASVPTQSGKSFTWSVPAFSLTVLQFNI
ncbi:MAG: hypothetical protein M1828_006208 [Chrysothrix sp. TS-e1954]|nr:MAG: hypothetical protein M1828_006208 [Chrysothrix sp. TS-e1954]